MECDVTFTTLRYIESFRGGRQTTRYLNLQNARPHAWNPSPFDRTALEVHFRKFGHSWCLATEGYSRIRNIYVYTDGSDADFQIVKRRGRAYAYGGTFPTRKPSAIVYYPDLYLGEIMAHEFAHSALKIFDEYRARIPGGIIGITHDIFG